MVMLQSKRELQQSLHTAHLRRQMVDAAERERG